jgi:hypothetical protein
VETHPVAAATIEIAKDGVERKSSRRILDEPTQDGEFAWHGSGLMLDCRVPVRFVSVIGDQTRHDMFAPKDRDSLFSPVDDLAQRSESRSGTAGIEPVIEFDPTILVEDDLPFRCS